MKQKIKKSMAMILVMVMVVMSIPATIFAEENSEKNLHAVSTPTDAIIFGIDGKLLTALTATGTDGPGVDKDTDGFITKTELKEVTYLNLKNKNLTDLTGLEFATGLKTLTLSENENLMNIEPIREIAKNLIELNLEKTKVSAADRISLLYEVFDMQINKGVTESLHYLPSTLLNDFLEENIQDITFDNPAVASAKASAMDNAEGIDIVGTAVGTTIGRIKSGTEEKTFNITVNDFAANQPVGTPVTELPKLVSGDTTFLDTNGELWEIGPDGRKVLIKNDIKDYQTRNYSKNFFEPDLRLAIDKNDTLWLKNIRTDLPSIERASFIEQVKDVKGISVGEWAYQNKPADDNSKFYWDLILDKSDQLWIMDSAKSPRAYVKSLSNVESFSGQFALTKNKELHQIYKDEKILLSNIIDYDYFMDKEEKNPHVYALTKDHNLLEKKPSENEFSQIDTEVKSLIKSDEGYPGGIVKNNESFWKYSLSGSMIKSEIGEGVKGQLGPFVIKEDGSCYYKMNDKKVLDNEIKTYMSQLEKNETELSQSELVFYMVDSNSTLWKFSTVTEQVVKVGSDFKYFLKIEDYNENKPTGYSNSHGDWFDLEGNPQTKENIVIKARDHRIDLRGDKVAYYGDVALLDHVLDIVRGNYGNVYATRTDGTVWIVSSSTPPKKIEERISSITVTFDTVGGTPVNPIENLVSGTTINKLPTTTRSGYTFNGWFTKENKAFTTETKVTKNMTVYARWTKNTGGIPTPPTPTPPTPPDINTDKAVEEINKAPEGSTVTVPIKNKASLPKNILETAKGKDVKVELNYGDYQWVIDGKTIGDISEESYDLNVEKIKDENLSNLVEKKDALQLEIKYSGALPFTATLTYPAGATLNGKTLHLYYYNEVTKKLEYKGESKVTNGNVTFVFDHASKYVLTETAPEPEIPEIKETKASYKTHIQDIGWKDWTVQAEVSGTSGRFLRMEAMNIKLDNPNVGIRYQTHIQNSGWNQGWKADGLMSGTEGAALRMEALKVELTGKDAVNYDVYYQVHAQNYGWLPWAKNGEASGTAGYALQLEGIRVVVVSKGEAPPKALDPVKTSTDKPFYEGSLKH